ncbi:hypothetical protein D0B32_18960 [Paraburkholderia sp. DHOC27]|nr:hypothetical protein D0B32_18960 [Paraburkholderia sp. DHOC27]
MQHRNSNAIATTQRHHHEALAMSAQQAGHAARSVSRIARPEVDVTLAALNVALNFASSVLTKQQ